MKEYVFTFQRNNYYMSSLENTASFNGETQVRLIIEPHEYELKLSDEVLRSSSCKGYTIEISNKGGVCVFDEEGNLLVKSEETQNDFREFRFEWKQDFLTLRFGHKETVDNYPNCDGESDRWDTRWFTDYEVKFDTVANQLI